MRTINVWSRASEEARNNFGKRVLKLRREAGLTQAMLFERTGIAVSHISHIENGNANPSLEVMVMLATALGVELSELVKN
jgi:transcriptional regulator with XRE-family HTH domain